MTFTIALLQLATHGTNIAANTQAGVDACRQAKALGADLALFPEQWSIGYTLCPADEAGRLEWEKSLEYLWLPSISMQLENFAKKKNGVWDDHLILETKQMDITPRLRPLFAIYLTHLV